MTTPEQTLLALACQDYGVPIPAAVTHAVATVKAGEEHLATLKAEAAPDLATATAANIAQLADASAGHASQDQRIAAAYQALGLAVGAVSEAWAASVHVVRKAFRDPFDTAAAKFVAAADALEPARVEHVVQGGRSDRRLDYDEAISRGLEDSLRDYRASAAQLAQLARVRDILDTQGAGLPDLGIKSGSYGYERLCRFAVIPDRRTAQLIGGMLPTDLYEPEWWYRLARVPHVTLKWQDPTELIHITELPAQPPKARAAS